MGAISGRRGVMPLLLLAALLLGGAARVRGGVADCCWRGGWWRRAPAHAGAGVAGLWSPGPPVPVRSRAQGRLPRA